VNAGDPVLAAQSGPATALSIGVPERCLSLSGLRLDGGVVDPCFVRWGGGDGCLVAESFGVRGVGGVEDGLAGGDDRAGGAGWVQVAER